MLWIFGYGSLLWKPNFPYTDVKPGVVRHFSRKFWQLSPDHRGTIERPGRVVTLVPDSGNQVFGLAFRVPDDHVESTIEYLNLREQAGYERVQVLFHPNDGSESFPLDVYISINDPENIYYNETASVEDLVDTIISSQGTSGTNLEYALRIAAIHREMAPHIPDAHLFEIEARLLKLCEMRKVNEAILKLVDEKPAFLLGA